MPSKGTTRHAIRIPDEALIAPHGTRVRYATYGCRCDQCVKAYNDYMRDYMRKRNEGK